MKTIIVKLWSVLGWLLLAAAIIIVIVSPIGIFIVLPMSLMSFSIAKFLDDTREMGDLLEKIKQNLRTKTSYKKNAGIQTIVEVPILSQKQAKEESLKQNSTVNPSRTTPVRLSKADVLKARSERSLKSKKSEEKRKVTQPDWEEDDYLMTEEWEEPEPDKINLHKEPEKIKPDKNQETMQSKKIKKEEPLVNLRNTEENWTCERCGRKNDNVVVVCRCGWNHETKKTFCTSCGHENETKSMFCKFCGAKLELHCRDRR